MKIQDILSQDCIWVEKNVLPKKKMLEKMAHLAAEKTGLSEAVVLDALIERERLGTTGIGRGVAIPHSPITNLKKLFCAFVKKTPIVHSGHQLLYLKTSQTTLWVYRLAPPNHTKPKIKLRDQIKSAKAVGLHFLYPQHIAFARCTCKCFLWNLQTFPLQIYFLIKTQKLAVASSLTPYRYQ